ncbi:uncharacterized protein TRUGW13939_09860 [Talaromyces rugulosus]|uniref:F-box domain-containing protein n=1 Tax=Talaromyces rugulosus TaxID=121627 RepID=A0A7H8R8G8_TALRU|nr:uncharacterized protein TRUGW13939_09860 [Talaromyces rugulosus]QKX62699.1 hypothetical protein TRUGW13939_09860 [Talaromyces rugulosus]
MAALLGRIASFFARGKDTHDHIQRSSLEQLPTELILLIRSHLSPMDTACLTLCSHVLLLKIGTDSLLFANNSEQDGKNREDILTRISLDTPSYYFCHVCYKLHLWKAVCMPQAGYPRALLCLLRDDHGCLASIMNTNVTEVTTYFFQFVHLQLAMRRYQYGPSYGISTELLSHVEVMHAEPDGVTTLLSVEAQVCPGQENGKGSLLLRVQQWAKIPASCPDIVSLADLVYMEICDHIHLKNACKEFAHSSKAEKINTMSPMYQCHRCLVDFQFQIQDIETRGDGRARVLIVTKWLDLGDGLDPKDPQWVAQVHQYPKVQLPHRDIGSVCSRFESNFGSSQQELTHQNRRLMSKEGFRDVLRRHGTGRWFGRPRS